MKTTAAKSKLLFQIQVVWIHFYNNLAFLSPVPIEKVAALVLAKFVSEWSVFVIGSLDWATSHSIGLKTLKLSTI